MYLDQRRWLPATLMTAALFAASLSATAQTSTAEIASARPTSASASILPIQPPTPEALGDSLMAHRRYQAAIEAYKQALPQVQARRSGTRWALRTR